MERHRISQDLLYAVRTGHGHAAYVAALAEFPLTEFVPPLASQDFKKAFWINLYNAFVLLFLKENPASYRNKGGFFGQKRIGLRPFTVSLDDIEHGVLRRGAWKWGLGYVQNPFPGVFARTFMPDHLDFRIHFALNCGAASCPPIAYYEPHELDAQLGLALRGYLEAECRYDAATNTVAVPKLLSWYRGDFGGRRGIRQLLESQNIIPKNSIPQNARTSLRFRPYDWTLRPDGGK